MRRRRTLLLVSVLVLSLFGASVHAASCPYCGRRYGDGSGKDSAYIARIRAEHEATCPARYRRSSSSSSRGYNGPSRHEIAESRYQAALNYYNEGNYDKAIERCGAALWLSWFNKKYTDLLVRAQKRKGAQVSHAAGLNYHKSGHWDLAVMHLRSAVKGHPENQTYARSLKRALESQELAEQKKFNDRLATLSDELGRPSTPTMLDFRDAVASKPSRVGGRFQVPSPTIRRKEYYRIEAPERWPALAKEVIKMHNVTVAKLQDGADWVTTEGADKVERGLYRHVTSRLPGVRRFVGSVADAAKEVKRGLRGDVFNAEVDAFRENMLNVGRASREVGHAGSAGRFTAEYERTYETQAGALKHEAETQARKTALKDLLSKYYVARTKHAKPRKAGFVVIDKKKSDPYPDPFRIGPWVPEY